MLKQLTLDLGCTYYDEGDIYAVAARPNYRGRGILTSIQLP